MVEENIIPVGIRPMSNEMMACFLCQTKKTFNIVAENMEVVTCTWRKKHGRLWKAQYAIQKYGFYPPRKNY